MSSISRGNLFDRPKATKFRTCSNTSGFEVGDDVAAVIVCARGSSARTWRRALVVSLFGDNLHGVRRYLELMEERFGVVHVTFILSSSISVAK